MALIYILFRENKMENKQFTITKRIAKHGKQAAIIVPTLLQAHLVPGDVVKVTIELVVGGRRYGY
jgi:hypothetical protein